LNEASDLLAPLADRELEAKLKVLEAELALSYFNDPDRSEGLCRSVLESADAPPDVRCQALEIAGRGRRRSDLVSARGYFEQALETADRADLPLWRIRALHELGTIDMFDHAGTEKLSEAHIAAERFGALSTSAVLDLQLAVCAVLAWDPEESERRARSAIEVAGAFGLHAVVAKSELILADSYAFRGQRDQAESHLASCLAADPDDRLLSAFCEGVRGDLALVAGDWDRALDHYGRGADALARDTASEPAAFRALRVLMVTANGAAGAAELMERESGLRVIRANRGLLGYAEAVTLGREGRGTEAARAVSEADAEFVNCDGWRDLARLCVATAAREDGWASPDDLLDGVADRFEARGVPALASRCRDILGTAERPLARYGITPREATVLTWLASGLTNKEIAQRLGISSRTVEKHIETMLRKTGSRTRTELALLATTGGSPA
jgi:DNA-binding CsgD family transcriptional regulator/tetratricopeptide (TPR) repeat protein